MKTGFISGYSTTNPSTTVVNYNSCCGAGYTWVTTEGWKTQLVPAAGTLKWLRVELTAPPNGEGKSYAFTVMLNGNPTALTCTVTNAETSANDLVNTVAIVAGDLISLKCVPTGTPDVVGVQWSMLFASNIQNESVICSGDNGALEPVGSYYNVLACGYNNWVGDETATYQIVPCAGTLKSFYVNLSESPGAGEGDAYTFKIRVNDGDSGLVVTITQPATTGSDLVNTKVVAAGDRVDIGSTPVSSPSASPYARWGVVFVPDVLGNSMQLGSETSGPSDTDENYIKPLANPTAVSWGATDVSGQQLAQACTLSNLYVKVQTAPGAGKSLAFKLCVNGVDSSVVTTIADTDTTGNSGVNTAVLAAGDNVSLHSVPTGTPVTDYCFWGFTSYIALDPPTIVSGGMSLAAISAGVI